MDTEPTEIEQLRLVCQVALHWMETPGDFSETETIDLMDDLDALGYPK